MRIQTTARYISAFGCLGIVLLALFPSAITEARVVFALIATIQAAAIISGRKSPTILFSIIEIILAGIFLGGFVWVGDGDPGRGPIPYALSVWIFASTALATAAWICIKAGMTDKDPHLGELVAREIDTMHGDRGWRELLIEFFRPWKLLSFGIGIALLVVGSFYYKAPDWDVGISLIMGTLTYLTAPWVLDVIRTRRWKNLPAALFIFWVTVDGTYVFYNLYRGIWIYPNLRLANFFASSLLYLICGWLWTPRVGLRSFLQQLVAPFKLLSR